MSAPPDAVEQIRKRLLSSSAKPWRVRYVENQRAVEVAGPGSDREVAGWPFSRVAVVGVPGFANEDAEFIAHAPEDIAYLLAAIESRDKTLEVAGKAWEAVGRALLAVHFGVHSEAY